jgi:hypothetical protein
MKPSKIPSVAMVLEYGLSFHFWECAAVSFAQRCRHGYCWVVDLIMRFALVVPGVLFFERM